MTPGWGDVCNKNAMAIRLLIDVRVQFSLNFVVNRGPL